MDVLCTADLCPVILNATCVFYEGNNLLYTGINTNDSLQTALQKIDAKFGDAMVGYTFTNGVYQSVAGAPVGLGGSLTADTTIGGNFTLTFAGNVRAAKHITTGGTSSQFVKGDGTLDSNAYQVAGNYITALTGDVIANGPGSAAASLAVVNSNPGTYGSGSLIPVVTVDTKGRVTALTTTAINIPSGSLSFVGDVYGSGVTGSQTTLTLSNVNSNVYTNNTFLKFKVNAKGLVTGAAPVTHVDIEGALGYVPVPETRTITINGVTQNLQANRSWTLPGGGSVTNVSATAGTGISVSVTDPATTPNITITNTAPDQIVSIGAGAGINVTGTYPNFTVVATGSANAITDLIGEATASGPGVATVTLSTPAVTGKLLTGVNITGGSVVATDSILTAFGKLQNQINGLIGGSIYKGTWNASTNTPTLTSGVGTTGWYYIVSVPGTTNIDGITDWNLGDWIIFDGTAWQQVDNTDAVVSVNGYTGAVSLVSSDIPEGLTNLYYTPARARTAISLTTTGTSGAATYDNITGVLNIPNYTTDLSGYVPNTRTLTINGTTYDLSADRSWTVAGSMPTGGTAGQILAKIDGTDYNTEWIDNYATQVKNEVKLGAALTKGTPVYVSSADGTNMIVSASSNATEATSSKTFGLLETGGALNDFVKCVTYGLLAGLDTSAANAAGDPVWLGPNGTLLYGLANKPYAPAHMVYIGVVTRKQSNNGEIFINVQNGFEMDELHNVSAQNPANNAILAYSTATSLWEKNTIAGVLGYTPMPTITFVSPLYIASGGEVNIRQANSIQDGYLSSTDWNTFNNKANDSLVVHLAGTETITGLKTFSGGLIADVTSGGNQGFTSTNTSTSATSVFVQNNSTGIGILANNASTGDAILIGNDTSGRGIYITNATISGSGKGISIDNYNSGIGIEVGSDSSEDAIKVLHLAGRGLNIQSSGSGYGLIINNTTASTSAPFTIQKQGVTKVSFTDAGAATFAGALSGTSATFTGQTKIETDGSTPQFFIKETDVTGQGSTAYFQLSNNTIYIGNGNASYGTLSDKLTIASSGAATFSSSVTANSRIVVFGATYGLFHTDSSSYNTYLDTRYISADNGYLLETGKNGANAVPYLALGTADTERMRITSGGNVLIGSTVDSGYKLDVTGNAYISGHSYASIFESISLGTASAATSGWYKIGSIVDRGGGIIYLSVTGGSYSPTTYEIKYYKNWSNVGSLQLSMYGDSGYVSDARIRQDAGNSVYYIEIYIGAAVSFQVYHQKLLGYNATGTAFTGTLAAGSASGTTIAQLPFRAYGLSTQGITLAPYHGTSAIAFQRNVGGTMYNLGSVVNSGSDILYQGTGSVFINADSDSDSTSTDREVRLGNRGVVYATLTSAGNLGIGTTSPGTKLDVVGSFNVTGVSKFGSSAEKVNIGSYNDTYTGNYSVINSTNNGDITFASNLYNNATGLTTINNHGSMTGGAIVIWGNGAALGANTIAFYSQTPGTATAGTIVAATDARMVIKAGNVGIGTTSPQALLHLNKASGSVELRLDGGYTQVAKITNGNAGAITFETGATERMRITSDGKVGIGTSVPTAPFQVAGDMRSQGLRLNISTANQGHRFYSRTMDVNAYTTATNMRFTVAAGNNVQFQYEIVFHATRLSGTLAEIWYLRYTAGIAYDTAGNPNERWWDLREQAGNGIASVGRSNNTGYFDIQNAAFDTSCRLTCVVKITCNNWDAVTVTFP